MTPERQDQSRTVQEHTPSHHLNPHQPPSIQSTSINYWSYPVLLVPGPRYWEPRYQSHFHKSSMALGGVETWLFETQTNPRCINLIPGTEKDRLGDAGYFGQMEACVWPGATKVIRETHFSRRFSKPPRRLERSFCSFSNWPIPGRLAAERTKV